MDAEALAAHVVGELRREQAVLAHDHVAPRAIEARPRRERAREVEVERLRVVTAAVLLDRAQVDQHGILGQRLDRELRVVEGLQVEHPQIERRARGERVAQWIVGEPRLLGQHRVEPRLRGRLARHERAVFADRFRELVGADRARATEDLRLVEADERPQHRERRGARHDGQVRQRLRRHLPHRVARHDRRCADLLGYRLGRAQHLTLEQDLPVTLRRVGAQRLGDRLEVDRVQARTRSVGPVLREMDGHAHHFAQVCGAAEIAEHEIAFDAALLHLPGRHRGVEAAREQRDRAALDAQRQTSRALRALGEERRRALRELEAHRHLGVVEVDAGCVREQCRAELALHFARAHGAGLAAADAPRAHGEVPAAHGVREQRGAHAHEVGQRRDRVAFDERQRRNAEHARERVIFEERVRGQRGVQAVVRDLEVGRQPELTSASRRFCTSRLRNCMRVGRALIPISPDRRSSASRGVCSPIRQP